MRSDCGGRRYGFKDQNTRYRKRYLDLIFNPEVPDPQSTSLRETQLVATTHCCARSKPASHQ